MKQRKPAAGRPSSMVLSSDGLSVFAGRRPEGSKRKRSKSVLRRKPRTRVFTVRRKGWLDDIPA